MPSVSSILASVCVLTSTVLADVGVFFTSSANFCSESLPLNGLGSEDELRVFHRNTGFRELESCSFSISPTLTRTLATSYSRRILAVVVAWKTSR
jgi:hypothetical protein